MPAPSYETNQKPGGPSKKSLFERQKAEAEAKKAREKAETAAVYEDFVKSFDDDNNGSITSRPAPGSTNAGYGAPAGRRHFANSGLKSGPGSLGPVHLKSGPGSLGPAQSSYGRKRPFDDYSGRKERGTLSYHDDKVERNRSFDAFDHDEEERNRDKEELKAAAKPTLHLSSLPPGTSPSVIKALLVPSPLGVEDVRIIPSGQSSGTERKSVSAIVTLAAETSASDIDTVVSHLQNKYLGFGFNLSISRHLSSAALTSLSLPGASGSNLQNLPFGAKPLLQHTSLSNAPPPGHNSGRFAPPTSYTSTTPYTSRSNHPPTQVKVQTPTDLKQLKLIHKTVEALLSYGPEFEALLMSRPQIQRDEQWSWIWNPRSVGGVYYRWKLWEILTNAGKLQKPRATFGSNKMGDAIFEGQSRWVSPEEPLKFEYTTHLDEFVDDSDYNSSDEEDYEEGGLARRYNDHNHAGTAQESTLDSNDGMGYLNPLAKAKLVHLLCRLPETNAKLRRGDVARVTSFAVEHAGAGAEEISALITQNVIKPFCFIHKSEALEQDKNDDMTQAEAKHDVSPASLVGLYVVSDILSSSASAGVRHAWRYRSLFENALRRQMVFAKIGRFEKDLSWGKLKAEKWRRSVQVILSLWEGWSVFPQASHEEFTETFNNPPLTDQEKAQAAEQVQRKVEDETRRSKSNSKWRSVDDDKAPSSVQGVVPPDISMQDVEDNAMVNDELDGTAMNDDDLIDEKIDGWPMEDSSDEEQIAPTESQSEAVVSSEKEPQNNRKSDTSVDQSKSGISGKRQRPRAVDMFADDSE